MTDLFHDKASEWDTRLIPLQITEGVFRAMDSAITWSSDMTVMDFSAGTGLVATKVAPRVGTVVAVDTSPAMLEQLAKKPELQGKVELFCQDILDEPLNRQVDGIVSAMAAHHVEDTAALLRTLYAHLVPGGRLALADLDSEDGSFHPPEAQGVFHDGFDRDALADLAEKAGFVDVVFVTACTVDREERRYPIFLCTATRPL